MSTTGSFQVSPNIDKGTSIGPELTTNIQAPASGNPGNPHNDEKGTPEGQKEKAQTIQLIKRIQVVNPNQKTVYDSGDTPCESFVVAFIRAIWSCFERTIVETPDINNIPKRLTLWSNRRAAFMHINAPSGRAEFGPVVGSGSAPLSNFDHRLDAQIHPGSEAGQLSYGDTYFVEPDQRRGALELNILRRFTNRSAVKVTIAECGIYCYGLLTTIPAYHCIIRDLVSPIITVSPDYDFLLEYKILTRV